MSARGRRVAVWGTGVLLVAAVVFIGVQAELDIPTGRSRREGGRIRVPEGASMREVTRVLADSGWVRAPRLLDLWGRGIGLDRAIQPGRYRLRRGWSPREVMVAIRSGRVETTKVAIPEGWREDQILRTLADSLEIDPADLRAAADDTAWIRAQGIPRPGLEGYLFPATYTFPKETAARRALHRMIRESSARFTTEMQVRADRLGVTRDDIVTLASIVQAEAARSREMPRIAGVFWRRLHLGWKLEADPTVRYALDRFTGPLLYRDLEVASPYNTYRAPGLPPGPICNPGIDALRAVLWPDTTGSEMYFVAKGDGEHAFSRSLTEHNRARRAARLSMEGRR